MSMIMSEKLMQAFNWMLIHSLWQGLLAAVIAVMILMFTHRMNAAIRYNLIMILFSFLPLLSIATFVYEWNSFSNNSFQAITGDPGIRSDHVLTHTYVPQVDGPTTPRPADPFEIYSTDINDYLRKAGSYFSENSFLMVMLWFILFITKSLTVVGNRLYVQKAKKYQIYAPDDLWRQRIAELCTQLQITKSVLLFESGYLKAPVVVGYLKPVILIPVGLIARLPTTQVEAVLLHELAHIKRNDYIINLFQNILESVFFFNPGLLWISSLIREERENCCDDIAISHMNNKEEFVRALISFKEYALISRNYAVAFFGEKYSLANRVLRILYQENKIFSKREQGFFMTIILTVAVIAFALVQTRSRTPAGPKDIGAGIDIKINGLSGSMNIPAEQKSMTLPVVQTANFFEKDTPEKMVKLIVDSRKKWDDIGDEWQKKWNSRWAAINGKYNSLWTGNTERWNVLWTEHSEKWRSILGDAAKYRLPDTEIEKIKNEQKAGSDELWTEYKLDLANLKAGYDKEISIYKLELRAELDSLTAEHNKENQQLRSRLAIHTAATGAQENEDDPLFQNDLLLTEQRKAELFQQRYNLATDALNREEREEKDIHKQRDDLLVEWEIYLKNNPDVNPQYYWNIIGLNSQYDIKAAGMNRYYDKSYELMTQYLKENPGKAVPLDMELANLRAGYIQRRMELNATYVRNSMDREANLEYFRNFFELYADVFNKLSQIKVRTKMDDLNEEYIRRITELDLEIFFKKGEINERINLRNNEVVAENYRKRSPVEKLIISQSMAAAK